MTRRAGQPRAGLDPPARTPQHPPCAVGLDAAAHLPSPLPLGGGHSVGGHSRSPRGRSLSPSMAGTKPLLPQPPLLSPFFSAAASPPNLVDKHCLKLKVYVRPTSK